MACYQPTHTVDAAAIAHGQPVAVAWEARLKAATPWVLVVHRTMRAMVRMRMMATHPRLRPRQAGKAMTARHLLPTTAATVPGAAGRDNTVGMAATVANAAESTSTGATTEARRVDEGNRRVGVAMRRPSTSRWKILLHTCGRAANQTLPAVAPACSRRQTSPATTCCPCTAHQEAPTVAGAEDTVEAGGGVTMHDANTMAGRAMLGSLQRQKPTPAAGMPATPAVLCSAPRLSMSPTQVGKHDSLPA